MSVKDWLYLFITIGFPLITFIVGYMTMMTKFEVRFANHEELDKKEFNMLIKYSTEFFDRITKLELSQSAQGEINKSHTETLIRIDRKLDTIEDLLRSRGK